MNPRRNRTIVIRAVDHDVLVHDAANETVHILNRTAGFVLERCDGKHSLREIAQTIADLTGAEGLAVSRDVDAIVDEFRRLKLLEPDASGA